MGSKPGRAPTFGNRKHGATTQHGKSAEYIVWSGMWDRCRNRNNKRYDRYGGRGIRVCERWKDFAAFIADMGKRPSPEHTIERVNNDGCYEPENCRWALRSEQSKNQSHTIRVSAFGRELCFSEWERETGISRRTIARRIQRGLSPEKALGQ